MGTLFLSLAMIIGLARLLGACARRLHQPAIVGELLAGVVLGPTALGSISPELQTWLFPREGTAAVVLQGIASLSVVLFLLVAGMDVSLSTVMKQGRAALAVGLFGTAVPFALGFAGGAALPLWFGRSPDADATTFSLFLATAMAITALPVIAKTLKDLDLFQTDFGAIVMSAAVLSDLAGWTVFAFVLGSGGEQKAAFDFVSIVAVTLLFAVLMLTVVRSLFAPALRWLTARAHGPGGLLAVAVSWGLLGASFTEFIGIHSVFGAFLAGVVLGDSPYLPSQTREIADHFISSVFAPVFFASIGLSVNFIQHFDLQLVTFVLILACAGKIFGAMWGARWCRLAVREQWAIGFAMNARGAMEIVLGTLALEAGLIQEPLFVALVVMALVTSAVSGPLIRSTLETSAALPVS